MILRLGQILFGLAVALVSFDSVAGGAPSNVSIVYSPTPNSVPVTAMSPAFSVALALLVAAVLFRAMQNRGQRNFLAAFFSLVVFTALASRTNAKFINDAFAPTQNFNLSNQQGGALVQGVYNTTYSFTNTTNISQTINAISLTNNWILQAPTPSTPRCAVGYALAASTLCYVQFGPPPP